MQSRFFQCDGLRLHALERAGDGPVVVLIHGWLDHAHSFDWLVEQLPTSWRILALDLRGHGLSAQLPAGSTDSITDNFADLEALLRDACPDQKVHLLGHSRGGSVALMFAAGSERVASVTAIESIGTSGGAPERIVDRFKMHQADLFKPTRRRLYASVQEVAKRMREQNSSYSEAAALHMASHGTRAVEGGFELTFDPKLKRVSAFMFDEDQVLAILSAITCPRQVILAAMGLTFDDAQAKRRLDALRVAGPHVVEGNHHVHMDSPREVAELCTTFIESVERHPT